MGAQRRVPHLEKGWNTMIRKYASPIPNHIRVIFELPASLWADQISLVADFNHWNPDTVLFHQERDGVWRAVVDLPICRRFEFRYLIDGAWSTDIHADDVTPNEHGSFNSVVDTDPLVVHPDRSLGHGMIREWMATQTGRSGTKSRPAWRQETDATLRVSVERRPNRPVRRQVQQALSPHTPSAMVQSP